MGSGNIMPFNIFTKLFPSTTADQLMSTKDVTKIRTNNLTTVTQVDASRNKKKITSAKNAFYL